MGRIQNLNSRALDRLVTDAGNLVFSFNGTDYYCVPGVARNGKTLNRGGLQLESDLRLVMNVAQTGTTAESFRNTIIKRRLLYRSKTYVVDAVDIHPGGETIGLDCNETDRVYGG